MAFLVRTAATVMAAGIGYGGMYETASFIDSLGHDNSAVQACAQRLGTSVVKTTTLPDACAPYTTLFPQQTITVEQPTPKADGLQQDTTASKRVVFSLPPKANFLKQNLVTPETLANDHRMDEVTGGMGAIVLGVSGFLITYPRGVRRGSQPKPADVPDVM